MRDSLLPLPEGDAIPIGRFHSMSTHEGIKTYFCNLIPVDCHVAGDRGEIRLRIAKF